MQQAKSSMTNVVSALTARTQLGQIIKRATQKNERFLVGRRGEPSVVIMSVKDYMKTFAPPPAELVAMQAGSQKERGQQAHPRSDQSHRLHRPPRGAHMGLVRGNEGSQPPRLRKPEISCPQFVPSSVTIATTSSFDVLPLRNSFSEPRYFRLSFAGDQ